jgi:GNAT superfamily N-acetyltransferase
VWEVALGREDEGMAANEVPIRPMRADQLARATEINVRAFFDDPLFATGFPDPTERARVVRSCAAWCFRHAALFGTILVADDDLAGVAHVYRSATPVFTAAHVATSIGNLEAELGPELWDRYVHMQAPWVEADAALSAAVPGPQWYLDMIAVLPERQGQGIGHALLRAIHARADADGWPVALLTFQPRNRPLYVQQGYEAVASGTHRPSGLAYWCYQRPARTHDPGACTGHR